MIKTVNGDVLNSKVIVHQANCITVGFGRGLAKDLFSKYPFSNVYIDRKEPSKLGTIDVRSENDKTVIACYAQYDIDKTEIEFGKKRVDWFRDCLRLVAKYCKEHSIKEIGMPHGIGCGLAGGNWYDYYKEIKSFVHTYDITVVLYCKNSD